LKSEKPKEKRGKTHPTFEEMGMRDGGGFILLLKGRQLLERRKKPIIKGMLKRV